MLSLSLWQLFAHDMTAGADESNKRLIITLDHNNERVQGTATNNNSTGITEEVIPLEWNVQCLLRQINAH